MVDLINHLNTIGLTENDIDEKVKSVGDLVICVSSSTRLFRKTLKHILFKEIRIYFDNDSIGINDELSKYFPRKGRRFDWIKFSNFFNLKIPRLKLSAFAIALIVIDCLSVCGFVIWIAFGQTDLLIHSLVSKIPLLPLVLSAGLLALGFIAGFGSTRLPAQTFDDLVDEIISKNFADLLCDDRKVFKEIVLKELSFV